MKGIQDKVAIVSGGATLIGAAIAREFLRYGASVVIADIDAQRGEALQAELGGKARFVRTDLLQDREILHCVEETVAAFGRIDFLVNVACSYVDDAISSDRLAWTQALNVNLIGAAMLLRAAHPHLAAKGGAVVNLGSTSARAAQAGRWLYPRPRRPSCSSRAAGAGPRRRWYSRQQRVARLDWSGVLDTLSGGDKARTNAIAAPFHMLGRVGSRRKSPPRWCSSAPTMRPSSRVPTCRSTVAIAQWGRNSGCHRSPRWLHSHHAGPIPGQYGTGGLIDAVCTRSIPWKPLSTPCIFFAAPRVPANTARRVDIPGFPALAVFNPDGSFFVTDDRCTHGEASLCEGEIDGDTVECPFHQGTFDIRTGKPTGAPCRIALRTYDVTVEQGGVHIRQPE